MDLLDEINLNIDLNETEIIEEANISSKEIKAPGKKKESPRNILISGADKSSHEERMKVSKRGVSISQSTSHKNYISIYRKNKNTITFDGDLDNIDMSSSEYKFYEDLFIRNENIIKIARYNDQYKRYADIAFVKDEKYRSEGKAVVRDIDGNATIYKDASMTKIDHRENIKGEEI